MPVRTNRKPSGERGAKEYDYDDLLIYLRAVLEAKYEGLTGFLRSDKYKDCGFSTEPKELARMMTVLSLPTKGTKKKVRSFPILQVLFKELVGIELTNRIEVIRVQKIVANKILEPAPAPAPAK